MQTQTSKPVWTSPVSPFWKRVAGTCSSGPAIACSTGHKAAERQVQGHSTSPQNGHAIIKEPKQNGQRWHSYKPSPSTDDSPTSNPLSPAQASAQLVEPPVTDLPPFSLHQLHAFKTVVATGSKQQTADILGATGPNVSMMLNKLEKVFDEQLLIRSKGAPVQLTPAGQLLLRYTDRMLSLCNDAVTAAKDVQDVKTGTMTVGASQTTGVYLMPQLIGIVPARHTVSTMYVSLHALSTSCTGTA